jgi:putative restriction endonuclease
MTQPEQAVLIWPVLALAAREQKILSYSDLAGFTGIAEYGLGEALGLIHAHCERKKWPLLNSIVVLRETGVPGGGFPAKNMTPMEVSVMQSRVFLFDWSGHDKPRVHDFSATA